MPIALKRNFLPEFIGIAMTKSQFCFCTGCSPYKLRCILQQYAQHFAKFGYQKYDKLLMPAVVRELLYITKLRIDVDYYMQYVAGERGQSSQIVVDQ